MLTHQELQSLRNIGNEAEAAVDEIEKLRSELARMRAYAEPARVAESLFRFIEHGDEAHRDWLRTESLRWARAYFVA